MYEQLSHSILNEILDHLEPELKDQELNHFYTRLGANFYSLFSLFQKLYGRRHDFKEQLEKLVAVMARQYIRRSPELRAVDLAREKDFNWFLNSTWVGMPLYVDGFADDLPDLQTKLDYFTELGINLVHLMPILECPQNASDGGYAVSNYRKINQKVGDLEDLLNLAQKMRQREILLALDIVVNHTSDEHEWAEKARQGDETYQKYYYMFDSRDIPDMFEKSLPEVFPETSPGNFTWDDKLNKWVMTVFNSYQWDLNYQNPAVLIEMVDIILFWGNQGIDILRLDAVAFLWKKLGSYSQNEEEAHIILQIFKDCCQITSPGVIFIAEAIVAPMEIVRYFGEDAIQAKECEIAYNATFMALLWDAVATKNTRLLVQGLKNIPEKLQRATWLNYIRCHDDIGLGFTDADIAQAGYEPRSHREFLIKYFTGQFEGTDARGLLFGQNPKNNDARLSGTLTSLIGLETACEQQDHEKIQLCVQHILLLHSMICSFGGIPLIYYGDEIGTFNDYSYVGNLSKANDTRWAHRPKINWQKAELRKVKGTIEYQIFTALQRMIQVRKKTKSFADFNNRVMLNINNEHIFAFVRTQTKRQNNVLVVGNFSATYQYLDLDTFDCYPFDCSQRDLLTNLYSGKPPEIFDRQLVLPPFAFYWLIEDERPSFDGAIIN
ncbi:alpha-amylase family glycosyl hydrolase [[Limnothrix rosea] IAM M-220]|uniref:alpha-amylase family glycosyl hydrolase n=1 Tax=[Limnothrix rosea] IAM M-220 TaxID=454133 RepID=UPI000969D8D7|nr:alpha-amylase family glycosyl hydrolase [[Limnothrix rosea] IAM M-220]OKH18185.1 alpha-amylase [[Limnothrix rosea] IAM M-220]